MRASLLLCLVAALVGAAHAECTACLEGYCYRKHRLSLVSGSIMDINRNTNVLYFGDGHALNQCELDTGLCRTIAHNWNVESLTVDQTNGETYGRVRDHTGLSIYKLDLVDKENTFLVDGGGNYVTYKDKLYYSIYPGNGVYTYEDGKSKIVPGTQSFLIHNFVIDKSNDMYFRSGYIKRLSNGVLDVDTIWDDKNWLTVDRDGNGMLIDMRNSAVYRLEGSRRIKVGAIGDVISNGWYYSPLFDRDNNIIYKNKSNEYFHLKRDSGSNCTFSYSDDLNVTIIESTVYSYSVAM